MGISYHPAAPSVKAKALQYARDRGIVERIVSLTPASATKHYQQKGEALIVAEAAVIAATATEHYKQHRKSRAVTVHNDLRQNL